MKPRQLIPLVLLAVGLPLAGAGDERANAWIRDVSVFDAASGAFWPHHDIVVRATRIETVRPTGGPPIDAKYVIEGAGKFAVPGVIDEGGRPARLSRLDAGRLLASGVTSIHPDAIRADAAERWRRDLDRGQFYGPRLVGIGPEGREPGTASSTDSHNPLDWLDRLIARRDPTIADTLRHATLSAAERAGRASDLGSIEPGKIADMVIVGANPAGNLRALGAVDAVIFRGDVLTRAHLNLLRQGRLKPGDDAGLPRGR
jgi:hypothetical protein